MKITKLHAENWMAHAHASLDITPLTIIAGPNGAGKSGLAEAIPFALLAENSRIKAKSERADLVRDGAEKGYVQIVTDTETVKRDITTGKLAKPVTGLYPANAVTSAVPFLCDPTRFTKLEATDRRALLVSALRVPLDPESMRKKLRERGHAEEHVKELPAETALGLGVWQKYAIEQAAQARGAWRAIAGETYGEKKAETWEAPAIPVSALEMEEAEALTGKLAAPANEAREHLATFDADLRAYQRAIDCQPSAPMPAKRSQAEQAHRTAQADLAKAKADLATAEAEDAAHAAQPRPVAAGNEMPCPCCGSILALNAAGELVEAPGRSPTHRSRTEAARNAVSAAEREEAIRKTTLEHVLQAERDFAAAQNAPQPPPGNRADLFKEAQDTAAAHTAAIQARDALIRRKADAEAAAEKTQKAATEAGRVIAWTKLAQAVGPDGIAAELLKTALASFNQLLAGYSAKAGWATVSIAENMEIAASGRRYDLLSESQRWRVDTILAVALAVASGIRFAVIDRFDVLDLPSRGKALGFLLSLTIEQEMETLIVLGTFKEKPRAPDGVAVHWIG